MMAFAKSNYETSLDSVELKWDDGEYGFSVSDKTLADAAITIKHVYMLYIYLNVDGIITVRKFLKRNFTGNIDVVEKELLKLSLDMTIKPNWPNEAEGGNLNSCIFQGPNRFIIVLGNKNWRFYNYTADGHKAITFLPQKIIYEKEGGMEKKTMLPGSFNTSFSNGVSDVIEKYNCYRIDNFVLDEEGKPLDANNKRPILFDINVEIPIAGSSKTALITIDPGGQNLGPH
jgi:hypothetical protein